MVIPKTPPPDWHIKFCNNLDKAIEFHRQNGNDPHNVGTAAVLVLSEVRELFGAAVCGHELPTPQPLNSEVRRGGPDASNQQQSDPPSPALNC